MANTSFLKVTNNAQGHLSAGISNSVLSFSLQAGEGALFPSSGAFAVSTNSEIILCDSRSVDTFTVNASGRGYDNTTAEAHLTGATVELRWISKHSDTITTAITSMENMSFAGVTFAQGGIPYRAAAGDGVLSPLAIGGTGAIVRSSGTVPAWLARGSANQVLKVNSGGTDIAWASEYGAASIVIGETPTGTINGSNAVFTTASTYSTSSLEVFKNGVRMKGGGADYTETGPGTGFTMTTAPATGTVLLVNYYKTVDFAVVGTNSLVEDETPTGTINGSNAAFTVVKASYIAGSLAVYLNGQKLTHTTDFTETTPASGTFSFIVAPLTGAIVRVGYQYVTNTSGNADTVDGFHASATATASTILPLNGSGLFPQTVIDTAILGFSSTTTSTASITGATDLTGLSSAVTVPTLGNRKVRVTAQVHFQNGTADATFFLRLQEGGTVLQETEMVNRVSGNRYSTFLSHVFSPTAAAHTYKLNASISAGTTNTAPDATYPDFICVEVL